MSIRTARGDEGFTDLSFHKRVSKDSPEIRAMGDLDELGSHLGLVKSRVKAKKEKEILERLQRTVYTIASEIAVGPEKKKKLGHLIGKEDIDWIELALYEMEKKLKDKSHFRLPGGSEVSALVDVARTVARRAERNVVRLVREGKIKNAHILTYLNCMSDVLFVMARKKALNAAVKNAR